MKRIIVTLLILFFILGYAPALSFESHASREAENDRMRVNSQLSNYSGAQLIGVPATGHDHSTWMIYSKPYLDTTTLTGVYPHYNNFTIAEIQNYIDSNNNTVFISRSHGTVIKNTYNVQIGTAIQRNNNTTGTLFSSNLSMDSLNLSNMDIILFVACSTAAGGSSAANLPVKAVAKGALCAVGFSGTIVCTDANTWTISFCYYMAQHKTVQQACSLLSSTYSGTGLENHVIMGSGSAVIN